MAHTNSSAVLLITSVGGAKLV